MCQCVHCIPILADCLQPNEKDVCFPPFIEADMFVYLDAYLVGTVAICHGTNWALVVHLNLFLLECWFVSGEQVVASVLEI